MTRARDKIDKNHIEMKMRKLGIPGISVAAFNAMGLLTQNPLASITN